MYHLWPNIPTPSTGKLKRDHITYQCKGSVGGGGGKEAGHGVGIWHFSKICCQIPCPQANHSSQMHKNFLELISFIRVATVREKSGKSQGKTKIFQGQGKVRELCFLVQCIKVGNGPLKAKWNLSAGCKESDFYSLPLGQGEANIY